jgi:hypothetical protein
MLAEINFAITKNGAVLILRKGEAVIDQESWSFPDIGETEATEAAKILFDDAYDFINTCVHGDPLEIEIQDNAGHVEDEGNQDEQ